MADEVKFDTELVKALGNGFAAAGSSVHEIKANTAAANAPASAAWASSTTAAKSAAAAAATALSGVSGHLNDMGGLAQQSATVIPDTDVSSRDALAATETRM